MTDGMCPEWFAKFLGAVDVLATQPFAAGPCHALEGVQHSPASAHWKPIQGERQHAQHIQINKVIGEHEKCFFYFKGNT